MAIKPILFNTEMVRAILDGRKSCTRRLVKTRRKDACGFYVTKKADGTFSGIYEYDENESMFDNPLMPPYQPGDILYVRETWKKAPNGYYYYEDWQRDDIADVTKWKPSIHMPKEAARIWLKVTDVRGWSGCRICGRAMRQKKGYSLINQQQPMKCCKHLPNYGTAQSRNPTLTATDGMRIRGFGLSNLSGARSRNKRFNKIVD